MAGERKLSQRDEMLIKVLDRMSDNIWKQEMLLDEIIKQQLEQTANIERAWLQLHMRHDTADSAREKTHEDFLRYRSDMLHLVNEQDRLNDIVKDVGKKQAAIAFSQDSIVNTLTSLDQQFDTQMTDINKKQTTFAFSQDSMTNALADLDKRLETQEKVIREINTYTIRHEDTLSKEIADMNRNIARLHIETDKIVDKSNRETKKQLDEARHDTMRRLQALDEIASSLDVLLLRTEPPEKKPFFIMRLFRKFRSALKKIRSWWREQI